MKIGIMGGTFDPIHNGHIKLGEYAKKVFSLHEIWIMPNGNPPHKPQHQIQSSPMDRLKMTKLAIVGKDGFRIEEYEVKKEGVSCSYETMEYMKYQYPDDQFYFIIGADSLFSIENWVHPERLFSTCTVLAAFRDQLNNTSMMQQKIESLCTKYQADIQLLPMPLFPISSSQLREKIKNNESVESLIPLKVNQYIQEKGLYQNENAKLYT